MLGTILARLIYGYNIHDMQQGGADSMELVRARYEALTPTFYSLLILLFAAFMTRLLPLAISQYPINNDSITESLISAEMLDSGHLVSSSDSHWTWTYTDITPVLNILLAFFAGLLGTTPLACAQVFGAATAITTIGGVYLLGRLVSGSERGAITAAFMALMFGTFVFTTGSIWKEMMGLSLLVVVLFAYLRRDSMEFRVLMFLLLLIIPFVHHLVAVVTFLVFVNLLVWSVFFAFSRGTLTRTNLFDLATILIPGMVAATYYSIVGFDSMIQISSAMNILPIVIGFIGMNVLSIVILSVRRHVKWSFAPLVGVGLGTLILLDYSGYVFHYSTSATGAYVLLGVSSAFIVALAWFGSEVILEARPRYRAFQLALLLSPLTILGLGAIQGTTLIGQKIFYRSFDFLDVFIFLGAAAAMVELHSRRKNLYQIVGAFMIVSLAISFPFSYASQSLLGVRHDTQGYELDALEWMGNQPEAKSIVSDERISYLARSVMGVSKDSSLPQYLATNTSFPSYVWYYIIEDSWTTIGVNNYPYGELVVNLFRYEKMTEAADVFYLGGPADDNLVIFLASPIGSNTIYGPLNG
jgi:hypothetical protein